MTRIQMIGAFILAFGFLLLSPSALLSIPPFPIFDYLLGGNTQRVRQSTLNDELLSQFQHIVGVLLMAIGTAYATAPWHKQYEWSYMSVPARLVVSVTILMTLAIRPERVNGILLFIAVVDAIGALIMGCLLGFEFTGKVPNGEKERHE